MRAYAQAAVACGHAVIALDAFIDTDTKRVSEQAFKLNMLGWQLDEAAFKRVFSDLELSEVEGFLYGSLFDATPELLDWIAARVQIIGNPPEVLKKAKAFSFFDLLDDLKIRYPEVRLEKPVETKHWLCKQIGGSGGMHVRPASRNMTADYYQREVIGEPVSMLFVADGKEMQSIGFNRQLVAPAPELPYRFAGAVSGVQLPLAVEQVFCESARKLTVELGLRGICSLDGVLDGETLWVLELNPRLSATFDLYQNAHPNLFEAHMQGCKGELPEVQQYKSSCAQVILYADDALVLPLDFAWPAWAINIPPVEEFSSRVEIKNNAPICSVRAEAETAELAFAQVMQSAKKLKEMMYE